MSEEKAGPGRGMRRSVYVSEEKARPGAGMRRWVCVSEKVSGPGLSMEYEALGLCVCLSEETRPAMVRSSVESCASDRSL